MGGILLNAQHNFAWLTAGASNGIDLSRENGAASLLVTAAGARYLLANNIEMPRLLAEQVPAGLFEPVEFSWQEEKAAPVLPIDRARQIAGDIATDISLTANTPAIEGLIAKCRASLTTHEVERARDLGRDASEALDTVAKAAAPGDTEAAIAGLVHRELGAAGITSVVTLVAADERIAAYRHPTPTTRTWRKTLLLVTCARRRGIIVSLSRMISVGPPTEELQARTDAAAYVNARLSAAARPGVSGAELYRIAAESYAAAGYADEIYKHHQGGAAGYRTRDWVAHPLSSEIVQPSQLMAWNPSITGTKVEETMIAGENGNEVITRSSHFPVITTTVDKIEYHSPGILSV